MSLPKQNRLKSSRDFSRLYRKGQRAATKHLAVRVLKVTAPKVGALKVKKTLGNAKGVDGSPSTPSSRMQAHASTSACTKPQYSGPQFGISISRKVSKRAVIRNRIKRQLRAIIHQYLSTIDPDWQVVIVVRPPAVECSFDDFLRELEYLLKKLKIVT
ncbi:MAG: ribonuclease P protein component [Cyanobacteria bacterium P01_D01_bin.1]